MAQDGGDGGVVLRVDRGCAGDQCRRRRVGDEAAAQLVGDVARRRRVPGDRVDQRDAVRQPRRSGVTWGDERSAEDADRPGVVHLALELEPVLSVIGVDRPARQGQGHPPHVGLGVRLHAIDDPHRVQLEQLPAVVLVDSLVTVGVADRVVEVDEHRRAVGAGLEEVDEPAQGMGPRHLSVVDGDHVVGPGVVEVHVEVVGPELDHDLVELATAVDGPQEGGMSALAHDPVPAALDGVHEDVVLPVRVSQRLKAGEERCHRRIGDRRRGELGVEPAHPARVEHVALGLRRPSEGGAGDEVTLEVADRAHRDQRRPTDHGALGHSAPCGPEPQGRLGAFSPYSDRRPGVSDSGDDALCGHDRGRSRR